MAFISKSSKYLFRFKLGNHPRELLHQSNAKISYLVVSSPSHAHFSIASTKRKPRKTLNVSAGPLPLFSISSWHHLSTNVHKENIEVTLNNKLPELSSLQENIIENSTNKVLFVDAPFSTESTEILTDNVASTLITDLPSVAAEVMEPSLASLGLIHWTPVGLVEACLEYLHISLCMPWWVAIVMATAIARLLMFPVFIKTQKNAASMANYMPQMQYLQAKFAESRRSGNVYESTKCANQLVDFMTEHNISPFKSAMIPLIQAPIFISYFFALRSMAKLPVESMKIGGFSWITDLTIPDPYYIMPLMACSTLFIVLKIGAESGVRMENMKLARYFMPAIPLIAFPFCMSFPSAVLFYWCTNNAITLGFVLIMKIDSIRQYFGIPVIRQPDPQFVAEKKGMVQGIKDSFNDQKVLKLLEERRKMDEVRFQKAGTGPIPRTYAYDPTKPRPASAASAASRQKSIKM